MGSFLDPRVGLFLRSFFRGQGGLVGELKNALKNALKNGCFWGLKMAQKMRFFWLEGQNCAQTISPSAFGDCFAEREFPYKKKI